MTYLLLNFWLSHTTGKALSESLIGSSIGLFIFYAISLLLPRFGFEHSYQVAMFFALLFFDGGSVLGNIALFLGSGLERYSSLTAFVIGIAINNFGSILNVMALFRWYTPFLTLDSTKSNG